MRYIVIVQRQQSRAQDFASALDGELGYKPASVYVVGIDEAKALELALVNGRLEAEEMDARTLATFPFAEAIGTEERMGDMTRLIALADQRAAELGRSKR